VLVAGAYVVYFLSAGYDRFYHDSDLYWKLGRTFRHDGHFSLVSYDNTLRGYSLPLFNHGLQAVASAVGISGVTIVELTGALLAATLGVVVLPRLARQLFSEAAIGWWRVLALNGLVFLFWRDHFNFPLTDFPALLVASIGLLGLLRASIPGYLVAGLGFGLAANMRPAYIPAAVAVLCIAAVAPPRSRKLRERGAAAVLVLAGAIVASLPQMAINNHQRGTWSPAVPDGRKVAMLQLTSGLISQRYETYVGPRDRYPQARVFYFDPLARPVLEQEGVPITSYGQYLGLVLHNPVPMAGSYGLHVFNGFDVWYPTPYVRDLRDRRVLLSLLQYSLVFAAIARLVLPETRRRLGRISWAGVAVLIATTVTALPGVVEPRFFLPVDMLVCMLACFGPSTRGAAFWRTAGGRMRLAVCYLAFLALCLTLSAATRSHIEFPVRSADSPPSLPETLDL
jgi:hypothetical protein